MQACCQAASCWHNVRPVQPMSLRSTRASVAQMKLASLLAHVLVRLCIPHVVGECAHCFLSPAMCTCRGAAAEHRGGPGRDGHDAGGRHRHHCHLPWLRAVCPADAHPALPLLFIWRNCRAMHGHAGACTVMQGHAGACTVMQGHAEMIAHSLSMQAAPPSHQPHYCTAA